MIDPWIFIFISICFFIAKFHYKSLSESYERKLEREIRFLKEDIQHLPKEIGETIDHYGPRNVYRFVKNIDSFDELSKEDTVMLIESLNELDTVALDASEKRDKEQTFQGLAVLFLSIGFAGFFV